MLPYCPQSHCSCCKVPTTSSAENLKVVRSAAHESWRGLKSSALLAVLCPKCEEERQHYYEGFHGLKRGDIVTHHNGRERRRLTIASFYDESYFIDLKGYCISIKGIERYGRQTSLF